MFRSVSGLAFGLLTAAAVAAPSFVYETDKEFFGSGDFNGDGTSDVLVLNRFLSKYELTSRYRIAYQQADGSFTWGRVRSTEMAKVADASIGRFLDADKDALAVTAADASLINVIDVSDPEVDPAVNMYMGGTLGPNAVVAVDIGGEGNTPLDDLVTSTVFNDPVENHLETLRNEGGGALPIEDLELDGVVTRANPVVLKRGGAVLAAMLIRTESADSLRAFDVTSGEAKEVLRVDGLPKGSDYVVGQFGADGATTLVTYSSGSSDIELRGLTEQGGQYTAGAAKAYDLSGSVRLMGVVGQEGAQRLVVLFGSGSSAAVLGLAGTAEPKVLQTLESPEDEVFSGVVSLGDGAMVLVKRPTSWYTTHYQLWTLEGGQYVAGGTREMPTVDDSVFLIQPVLQANNDVTSAGAMKPYTNAIPGTKVNFSMMPIPGGEFVMGTPDSEEGREADESPQVKVKVDPFWMQTTEVTWDMYTLFMYSDEERKFKDSIPTDPEFDAASDAVARPSKPYTEMSFGMGKDGYPAIAMTHHAAAKFCEWLSAKTGHYYRLPTEAEWEFACRAGTTTAYSFGDSADAMDDYAWYEMNSDFVYQKVGKKKPNPWGLYDMHGNVMEWCLDGYLEDYSSWAPSADNPWSRPTKPYPHVARGGSYDDMAEMLRSGARRSSDRSWKMTDPQLPKSTWWLSDNKMIGFRVVRPLEIPDAESLAKRWNTGTERD